MCRRVQRAFGLQHMAFDKKKHIQICIYSVFDTKWNLFNKEPEEVEEEESESIPTRMNETKEINYLLSSVFGDSYCPSVITVAAVAFSAKSTMSRKKCRNKSD